MLFHSVSKCCMRNSRFITESRCPLQTPWVDTRLLGTMQSTMRRLQYACNIPLYSNGRTNFEQCNFPVVSAFGQLASGSACVGLWWRRSVHVTADSIFSLQYQAGCPVKYAEPMFQYLGEVPTVQCILPNMFPEQIWIIVNPQHAPIHFIPFTNITNFTLHSLPKLSLSKWIKWQWSTSSRGCRMHPLHGSRIFVDVNWPKMKTKRTKHHMKVIKLWTWNGIDWHWLTLIDFDGLGRLGMDCLCLSLLPWVPGAPVEHLLFPGEVVSSLTASVSGFACFLNLLSFALSCLSSSLVSSFYIFWCHSSIIRRNQNTRAILRCVADVAGLVCSTWSLHHLSRFSPPERVGPTARGALDGINSASAVQVSTEETTKEEEPPLHGYFLMRRFLHMSSPLCILLWARAHERSGRASLTLSDWNIFCTYSRWTHPVGGMWGNRAVRSISSPNRCRKNPAQRTRHAAPKHFFRTVLTVHMLASQP